MKRVQKTRKICFAKFCGAILQREDARILFCKVLRRDFLAKRRASFVLPSFLARFLAKKKGVFCFAKFSGAIFRLKDG